MSSNFGYTSVREVAANLGVTIDTIKKWCIDHNLDTICDEDRQLHISDFSLHLFMQYYEQICPRINVRKAIIDSLLNERVKYEIVSNMSYKSSIGNVNLYRIRSLIEFVATNGLVVEKGDLGGWIEKPHNLSQYGLCWVTQNAEVFDDARIIDNALVDDQARVFGCAICRDSSVVCEDAMVSGHAFLAGRCVISGDASVSENAKILDNARVKDAVVVNGQSIVCDNSLVEDEAFVTGFAYLHSNAVVKGVTSVSGIEMIAAEYSDNLISVQ